MKIINHKYSGQPIYMFNQCLNDEFSLSLSSISNEFDIYSAALNLTFPLDMLNIVFNQSPDDGILSPQIQVIDESRGKLYTSISISIDDFNLLATDERLSKFTSRYGDL